MSKMGEELDRRLDEAKYALYGALEQALIHFQLLGSGQVPPNSNAEMCEIIGSILAKVEGKCQ